MKKKMYNLIGMLFFMLLFIVPRLTYAQESLVESEDYEEAQALTQQMLKSTPHFWDMEICENLTISDIRFDKAMKIYVDVDWFQYEHLSLDIIEENIAAAPYVWEIPIYYNDQTIIFTCTRDTEENGEKGKLYMVSHGMSEHIVDYQENIKHILADNQVEESSITYTVGGTPAMRSPMVLVETQDGQISIIPNEYLEFGLHPEDSVSEMPWMLERNFYTFEELKQEVDATEVEEQQLQEEDEKVLDTGMENRKTLIPEGKIVAICSVLILIGIIGFVIVIRKKVFRSKKVV